MTALDGWLQQATRHLAKDAAARVRSEIQQHYDSACEAAMASGASSHEAEQTALHALGDARRANREYRKVMLTRAEARMLREGDWEARAVCSSAWIKRLTVAAPLAGWTVAAAALLFAAAALLFGAGQGELTRDLFGTAVGLSPFLASLLLPIYTPARARVFRWLKWVALTGALALLLGPLALKWSWLLVSCLLPLAMTEWTRASIRRKLPVAAWPKHLYL